MFHGFSFRLLVVFFNGFLGARSPVLVNNHLFVINDLNINVKIVGIFSVPAEEWFS